MERPRKSRISILNISQRKERRRPHYENHISHPENQRYLSGRRKKGLRGSIITRGRKRSILLRKRKEEIHSPSFRIVEGGGMRFWASSKECIQRGILTGTRGGVCIRIEKT